jgi:hypothetical protein
MQGKTGGSARKDEGTGKTYYAVAFNIDPTITRDHALGACPTISCPCNGRHYYSTSQINITETVYASAGSVDAVLGAATSVVYTGQEYTLSLYNPAGYYRYSSIGGRNLGNNYYRLTGTWYAS